MSNDEDYDYEEDDGCQCPHCGGLGTVPCYCAGDFCICENDGDETCYVCGGEGNVTEARYERYLDNQRKNAEAMRKVFEVATK